MTYEFIETHIEDGVYVLKLNRPDKLNAINIQLELDWLHAIQEAEADESVRVILQHASGRSFSSGHDLVEVGRIITELGDQADDWQHVYDRIWPEGSSLDATRACAKLLVSAVHGQVVGQVVFQVLATDLVLAAPGTVFNLEVMRTGGAAGAAALLGLLPPKMVNEIVYLGRLTAEDLLRWGAINRVVDGDALYDAALSMAKSIARVHPTSLRAFKKAYSDELDKHGWADFGSGFDAIRMSHGNEADNEFWAMAATHGVKAALQWRDEGYGPSGDSGAGRNPEE